MKHPTSRMLHAYWDRIRGARSAPERSEIEPGEIRQLLADSLILELDMPRHAAAFRLAGTRVCALFGRELKGQSFGGLWGDMVADPWRMLEIVADDTNGVVAGLSGVNAAGDGIDLELLLLPLRHRGKTQTRALGTLSAVRPPSWLGLRPLVRLETVSLRILSEPSRPAGSGVQGIRDGAGLPGTFPPPANDSAPVRRGHLMVHRGGRG